MPRLRTSLPVLIGVIATSVALAYGCSSGASNPPNPDFGGTGGSTDGSAESSATGGTGAIGGVGATGGVNCTDPTDSDHDGIADMLEGRNYEGGPSLDTDHDGIPDYLDTDSDNDGISDKVEAENPLLKPGTPGQKRTGPCSPVADTDGDGIPDFQDTDSDGDGVPDGQDAALCPNKDCRVLADCDGDGVVDIVELAIGSDPCSGPAPPDAGLYFVLPYQDPPKSKNFDFSTGVKDADIYFMVDTTQSMNTPGPGQQQGTIDNVKASLDSVIIPAILNGDPNASPPIPAIPGAYIGIGTFRDVPWAPWGDPGDNIYQFSFAVGTSTVLGNVSAPQQVGTAYQAPDNVKQILGSLTAAGGGDSPEGTTQALWMAATNTPNAWTAGGLWSSKPAQCSDPSRIGRACFRPGKLPIFVLISDAPFHNGPQAGACPAGNDYVAPPNSFDSSCPHPPVGGQVGGTKTYAETVSALKAISAKIIGVSVNTGTPNLARHDMQDLATKTGSVYQETLFGGQTVTKPLVTDQDTSTGDVSNQVVRLIGLLAGYGLHDVTTRRDNYSCPGNVDCNGDGKPDPKYDNFVDPKTSKPFDATQLIQSVTPVPVATNPKPYTSLDATTFYGVSGNAKVAFKVTAQNTTLAPKTMVIVQAILHVQTPTGQALGGADGVKMIYFVIPPYVPNVH